ncbi:MAG: peptide deformylase [Acholeplasmatales bacterium]|nr:peptide deformylase [Acholeplasmatales bacterium]
MIKNIVRDINFLSQISTDLTKDDLYIIKDLKDTININSYRCVSMAANMIGYLKRCLIFLDGNEYKIMINPVILSKNIEYKAMEGCLSLDGEREVLRYKKIKVQYLDENFKIKIKTYTDYQAQIIQHEIDHFDGIII